MNKKNKCPSCGSKQTYVRLETQDRVCRSCGDITTLKQTKKALPDDSGGPLKEQQA